MMFIPYRVCVVLERWPVANFALVGVNIAVHVLAMSGAIPVPLLKAMVLDGWNIAGFLGHMFLHADLGHLIGNMIALWVFGNGVCARIGNGPYLVLYLAGGVAAALMQNLVAPAPLIGASGAINAILGFFVVLYPRNTIDLWYFIVFRYGTVEIASFWVIGGWFLLDLLKTVAMVDSSIAYAAHVGGFLLGFAAAYRLVAARIVAVETYDNPTLVDLWRRSHRHEKIAPARRGNPDRLRGEVRKRLAHAGPTRFEAIQLDPPAPAEVVEFACPHCGRAIRLEAGQWAERFRCPVCSGEIEVES